jgi:molybdate transport system regulatory protein
MSMSYRRAWQLVEAMNKSFAEPVVVTEVGGKRGGGATVTVLGKRIVTLYRAMENKASSAIAADLRRFSKYLRKSSARHAGRRSG